MARNRHSFRQKDMRSLSRLFTTLCLLAIAGTSLGQNARVQVVHNIPSAAADTVDVYVNGDLVSDDLGFTGAIPFTDMAAGDLEISINARTSTSATDGVLFTQTVAVSADSSYLIVAQGTIDAPMLLPVRGINEAAADTSTVNVTLIHGIPDAGPARVFSQLTQADIVTLPYGFAAPNLPFPAVLGAGGPIAVDLINAADSADTWVSKLVDLINLRGVAVVVIASGLLNPGAGESGPNAFAVFADGSSGVLPDATSTAIEATGDIPSSISLSNNFPNPFNPTTNFEFTLDSPQQVAVRVFDVTGRLVETLADGQYAADTYRVSFDAAGLSSGTYIYQVQTAEKTISKTMLLMK